MRIHCFFLAKFILEILSALAPDMGMTSKTAALDAWKQFYKNISGDIVPAEFKQL